MVDTWKPDVFACLSFNSYSSNNSAEIAATVADGGPNSTVWIGAGEYDDFQFPPFCDGSEISAGDIVGDSHTGTFFPVFDQELLLCTGDGSDPECEVEQPESIIVCPLTKLLADESAISDSRSSSEAGEPDNIPEGTYCVWRPRKADQSPSGGRRRKTGSARTTASKRWRFLDLLRSNSEGKDGFVFLTAKNREERLTAAALPGKAKGKAAGSAHEAFYLQRRAVTDGNKKKSYLPYRRDLVGLFVVKRIG